MWSLGIEVVPDAAAVSFALQRGSNDQGQKQVVYSPVNAWPVRSLKLVVTIGHGNFKVLLMKGKVSVWLVWEGEDQGMLAHDAALPSSGHAILQWLHPVPCYVAGKWWDGWGLASSLHH